MDQVIAQMSENKNEEEKKSYGEKYYWTRKNLLSCIVKRMAIIWKIIEVLFYEKTWRKHLMSYSVIRHGFY